MGGDTHLSALPLRQYEVALQHADKVLSNLLQQPSKPWICFGATVRQIAEKAQALREQAAACTIQRAFRRWQICGSQPAIVARGNQAGKNSAAEGAPKQQVAAVQAAVAGLPEPAAVAETEQRPAQVRNAELPLRRSEAAPSPVARPPAAPAPPRVSEATGALNPIEKRRQLVASQLAVANPSRLSRNRRLQMEQSKRSNAADTDKKSGTAAGHGDSRQSTPKCRDTDKKPLAERPAVGLSGPVQSNSQNDSALLAASLLNEDQRRSRRAAAETGGLWGGSDLLIVEVSAGADEDELECSTGGTPESPGRRCRTPQEVLDEKPGSITPRTVSTPSYVARAQCGSPSPRRPPVPPHNVAPRPGNSSRGPPSDLLLKDNLPDDDPLEFAGGSVGCSGAFSQALSMAPPSSSSRPQSPWRFAGQAHPSASVCGPAAGSRGSEKYAEDDLKFYDGGKEVMNRLGTATSTAVPSASASGVSSPECFLGCESGYLGLRQFR